jgi:hypothetical protein
VSRGEGVDEAAAALHRIVVEPGGQSSSERLKPLARRAPVAALGGAVTALLDYEGGNRTSATAAATRSTTSGGIWYQSGSRTT